MSTLEPADPSAAGATSTSAAPPAPTPFVVARSATPPRPARRWGCILASALLLLPFGLCAPLFLLAGEGPQSVADNSVLELDLEDELQRGTPSLFADEKSSLPDVLAALRRAETDPKVKGLVAKVGSNPHGLAVSQELRGALARFQKTGKFTVAWAETYGELSPGTGAYYLASAFDEVWIQPSGELMTGGLSAETPFLKDAFAKAGVEPRFSMRKEFKNAPNSFVENTYTEPHRAATARILDGSMQIVAADIASRRPQLGDAATVRALLEGGPWSSGEALEKKLVDRIGYRDQVMASIDARVGGKASRLWLARYLARAEPLDDDDDDATTVAYIEVNGAIGRGRSQGDPIFGNDASGSDTISAAVRAAAEDEDVRAILLRVDSPGGSYVGSDVVWREIERAKLAGKKVVASFGNTAASGGYFIAMGADRIVASPATITGSIGVYAGKFVTAGLWKKLGVEFETLSVGDANPSFSSTDLDYSERARAKLEAVLDRIYADFVGKAAAGRKVEVDVMEPKAHGRVWIGVDAHAEGLVDVLGGTHEALGEVRSLLALAVDAPLRLKKFPEHKTPVETILERFGRERGDNSDDASIETAIEPAREIHQARAALARAGWADVVDAAALRAELPVLRF